MLLRCSVLILLLFPLPQSRTPALIFEHVNNTDFKVGKVTVHPVPTYAKYPVAGVYFLGALLSIVDSSAVQ